MTSSEPYILSEYELDEIVAEKTVVLFGAGFYGEKTLNLMKKKPAFFMDNNTALHDSTYLGLPIRSEQYLQNFLKSNADVYVVICVTEYGELEEQLHRLGLEYGVSCGITPMERDLGAVNKLLQHDQTILFSNYDDNDCGGLYLFNTKSKELTQLVKGSTRGFIKVGDYIYVCTTRGLVKLDATTFEEKDLVDVDSPNICGICFDPSDAALLIGGTQKDEIIFVDVDKLRVRKRLQLSNKHHHFGRESHHVNDLVVMENYILVSMFSLSGWWRYGICDGGILEIDKTTEEMRPLQVSNTWMPHSLKVHHGTLYILDSMNGRLLEGCDRLIAEFQGFLRGLEIKPPYFYIGQSRHRHISRLKDRINLSIDSGIYIYDMVNRISRFMPFERFANIYEVQCLDRL